MKTGDMKRALLLANLFNLLVAIYFIIISIVSLVQLRWYHQLTITIRVRHLVTSATSYFAFIILIFAALILIVLFVLSTVSFKPKTYPSLAEDAIEALGSNEQQQRHRPEGETGETLVKHNQDNQIPEGSQRRHQLVLGNKTQSDSSFCCSIFLHLIVSISLVVILVVWLLNTGELVRDSISTQLDTAFSKYQFANRSNHYSVAIDGMQDINNCCGSLDYSDFPHQRTSGLSSGHYPGSCCNKNIFGVNARVICVPEEIVRARQTSGCVTVLASYYDLISLLVVPVSLASLFVNITIIALITIARGNTFGLDRNQRLARELNSRFELKTH